MPESLASQCIWEDHIRNVTVLFSGYPHPSVSWTRADGRTISHEESAFKQYLEPYWENDRPDQWMANLEVRTVLLPMTGNRG